jgi:hypothetical protein
VDSLAAAGMVLGQVRTGRITALSGEWETCGEQIEMDAGVICTLTRLGDVVVEDYSLDGFGGPVYRKGQDTVICPLPAEFRSAGPSPIGLVADRWGPSQETDLDDIVTGGPTPARGSSRWLRDGLTHGKAERPC